MRNLHGPIDPMMIFKSERMRKGHEEKMNHFSFHSHATTEYPVGSRVCDPIG
jgi:hypothetical protein